MVMPDTKNLTLKPRILHCWCGYRCMRMSPNLDCPYGHGDMEVVAR